MAYTEVQIYLSPITSSRIISRYLFTSNYLRDYHHCNTTIFSHELPAPSDAVTVPTRLPGRRLGLPAGRPVPLKEPRSCHGAVWFSRIRKAAVSRFGKARNQLWPIGEPCSSQLGEETRGNQNRKPK